MHTIHRTNSRRRRTMLAALLAAPILIGTLVACSPTGSPTETPGAASTAQSLEDWSLEAAKCMRAEGFDVPDPVVGKGFTPGMDIPEDVLEKCLTSFEQVK